LRLTPSAFSLRSAVFGDAFGQWPEKTFFSGHQVAGVYYRLTLMRFFGETAGFEYGV